MRSAKEKTLHLLRQKLIFAFIKVFYSPTNAQVSVLKTILKFTLK